MKIIFLIYVKFFMSFYSGIVYSVLKLNFEKGYQWHSLKNLSLNGFSNVMKKMDKFYKIDPLKGALDYTIKNPEYFFNFENDDRFLFTRDCDDFSYMWLMYAKHNGLKAQQIYLMDGWKFWRSHATTVLITKSGFILCDYWITGKFDTLDAVIDFLKNLYEYENIHYVKGRKV